MQYQYYDRPIYVPVILDLSSIKAEDLSPLLESLEQYKPAELTYPSQYALDSAKALAKKGWPSLKQPLPLNVSGTEMIQIFAMSLKTFNEFATVRAEPNTSIVNKLVSSTSDFERMVDELTAQQDPITLSLIFNTGSLKSRVLWTSRQSPVNARLSKQVVNVARASSKKAQEERLASLIAVIDRGLEAAAEEEMVSFKKQTGKPFQYR